jgi:hypothetical protein
MNLMIEIFSLLREKLKNDIKIEFDDRNYTAYVWVKSMRDTNEIVANPNEVRVMLLIFGGLNEKIPLKVEVNNNSKIIKIIANNKEDYILLKNSMENIWDKTVNLLEQVNVGNLSEFRKIKYED